MKFWQKRERGLNLLCTLDYLRSASVMCDFEVRIDGTIFRAHKIVLMASSGYFRDLLRENARISKQGFVDLRGLDTSSVRDCLEFIYSGTINISFENVQRTLETCTFMQIDDVKDLCFQFLQTNLTPSRSFDILNYAGSFQSPSTMEVVVRFIADNYKEIIKTSGYQKINRDIVVEMLRTGQACSSGVLWEGITRWIQYDRNSRKCDLLRLLKEIKSFDPKSTWDMMTHPLINEDENAREYLIISIIFDQWDDYKNFIDDTNCFIAYKWTIRYNFEINSELFRSCVFAYMITHFDKVCHSRAIPTLTITDFYALLDSVETKAFCQKLRWQAIVNWIEGDRLTNEVHFEKLWSLVDFDNLPPHFMRTYVRTYRLVENSNACKDRILEAMFNHMQMKMKINSCLLFNKSNGEMHRHFNDSWKCIGSDDRLIGGTLIRSCEGAYVLNCPNLYRIKPDGSIEKKTSCPNLKFANYAVMYCGHLFVFNGESRYWIYKLSDGKWLSRACYLELPENTSACSTEDGILFLGGGITGRFTKLYNPVSFVSKSISSMTHKRHNPCSTSVGKVVYLAGGTKEFRIFRTPIEVYCSKTNAWSIFSHFGFLSNWPTSCCESSDGIYIASHKRQPSASESDKAELQIDEAFSVGTSIAHTLCNTPQVKQPQMIGWACQETKLLNISQRSTVPQITFTVKGPSKTTTTTTARLKEEISSKEE